MDLNRWNGTSSTADAENAVKIELVGAHISISQDASSGNCGTYTRPSRPVATQLEKTSPADSLTPSIPDSLDL